MDILSAEFVVSNTDPALCPKPDRPEYAFIGRSNVGKSSLINMLTAKKGLAKTSGKPGKTQLINHFSINDEWYLVDLPGYGYASTSKSNRKTWMQFIRQYLTTRQNLMCTCILVDSRHDPQDIDVEFMQWMGENGLPFVLVFTKTDKLTKRALKAQTENYRNKLLESWEALPPSFLTSASTKRGRDEVLGFIDETNQLYQ